MLSFIARVGTSAFVINSVEVVNSLPDELKIPFIYYLQGYQYQEIAEKIEIPLGTVKSRIYFARKKMQKHLKDFR